MDMSNFFHMGGYAVYVWSSYTTAFVILGALTGWTFHRHRTLERQLAQLESVEGTHDTPS